MERSRDLVQIQVTAEKLRDELQVTISNSESTLSTAPSSGIGLRNCRERLQLIYGARASLELMERRRRRHCATHAALHGAMMRVLIVDDEAPARDKLRRWLAEQPDIALVGECSDGLEAAASIARLQPDAVFLDIQMPGMSGLEVAAQLEPALAPMLVFVTAYDEHAIKAFDLNAIDYLLKPYDKDRLHKTLDRLRGRRGDAPAASASAIRTARAQTGSSERLLVPQGEQLQLIDASSIHWIEADDNYVHVHTAQARYMLRRRCQTC